MSAYYNEIDPYAAQWLRNLIAAGHIAPGDVDERSILYVCPDDLRGYNQCHFFAGIGGWSLALRLAQWPDTRAVWTGSCPCQPFSVAGSGAGMRDERHLWPYFFALIEQCKPSVVIGEQVASKDAEPWLDLVQDDLEGVDYTFGALAFPSAGVGAPHIRDRLYWVGNNNNNNNKGLERLGSGHQTESGRYTTLRPITTAGELSGMADSDKDGCSARREVQPVRSEHDVEHGGSVGRLADSDEQSRRQGREVDGRRDQGSDAPTRPRLGGGSDVGIAGPTNGQWRDVDWLYCRDGKWRPVEPGTFPLAHGVPSRVGRLRGYGNAINVQAAKAFIECYLECQP